jgi:uncharacterized membrane protein
MSADAEALADVPLFALLDGEERFTLAGLLERKRVPARTRLFETGDSADSLFLIRSGRVRCFIETSLGETIDLAELGPGEVFGEISLLDGGPRSAGAETLDDAELLEMDRHALLEFIERHPHAALDLMTVMGRRLRHVSDILRTHVARNVNAEEQSRLTLGERVADRVATFGGSWGFILSFALVLVSWMALNVFRVGRAFDPYPFILLNLVLSTLAAIQAPIIMMSQNRQAAKDRLKADLDYDVNLKAELEVAQLHVKIDRLYETVQSRLAAVEHHLTALRDTRIPTAGRSNNETTSSKNTRAAP